MSVELLDKTRKINKLLHNGNGKKVIFNDVCNVLSEIVDSNVLVISKKGKVLGEAGNTCVEKINSLITTQIGSYIDKKLNERLLNILSTKENVNMITLGFEADKVKDYKALITPIDMAGVRLGTLFTYRLKNDYNIDDIILGEYSATVVSLEMMRSENEEDEEKNRKLKMMRAAINTLSLSEKQAISYVFSALENNECILVASKIADRYNITRSVIVNALRKLESAGIIESRSAGMKGTYIKVLNENIFKEINE